MQKKFWIFIITLNNLFLLFMLMSCSHSINRNDNIAKDETLRKNNSEVRSTRCTINGELENYDVGDLPCTKNLLKINQHEKLVIHFKITNKNSEDIYEYGHQELLRYKNGKIIEKIALRYEDDAYWNEVPFVRIRKQTFLADLDNDGYLEFAVFPFSPGSAIWGTVRIYSLKNKIEFWGEGRYQFEGDTFVQLGCERCSKFNSDACKRCY